MNRYDKTFPSQKVTLKRTLQKEIKANTVVLRMESMTFAEQIAALSRCQVAIGMHGSILILSLFLPPGATLVEIFPYGVPAENYTPYRQLARIPELGLRYLPWETLDPRLSVGHPNRAPALGGLAHLPPEEQRAILEAERLAPHFCCSNPAWLYRIYQDTEVDVAVRCRPTGDREQGQRAGEEGEAG